MANLVVLDAGPLVALIDSADSHHAWATECVSQIKDDFITCEAVISECYFLVRQNPVGIATLLAYLDEGLIRLDFNLSVHLASVTTLMRKYHDTPMSLADACLVRMSELHSNCRVFTLDSDFKRYRRHSRQAIPLIIPAP
jgi:predicted nucleic acid-binding protein